MPEGESMTKEKFNKHVSNSDLGHKVFNMALEGIWPVGLSKELVLVQDQEFGFVYATKEEELDNGLYTVIRSDGTIENIIIGLAY